MGYTPIVGQRFIIPTHQVELDITAVGGGTTDTDLTLASNLPQVGDHGNGGDAAGGTSECRVLHHGSRGVCGQWDATLLLRTAEQQHLPR